MDDKKNEDVENEIIETNLEDNIVSEEKMIEAKENIDTEKQEYDDIDEKDLLTPIEKKNKKKKIIITLLVIVIFSVFAFLGGIICVNKLNTNVYKNVYVLGVDLSGKTQQEVYQIVEYIDKQINKKEEIEELPTNISQIADKEIEELKSKINKLNVNLYQDNEKLYNISANDVDFSVDVENTTKTIMQFGRNESIIKNNYEILKTFFSKKEIELVYKCNEEKLNEICKNVELTVKNRFVDDKYSIDEKQNKLIITRGITGNTINTSTEKINIINNLVKQINNVTSDETFENIQLTIIEKKPNSIDIDEIYKEIKRDPKDAYIDKNTNPIKLVKEEVGYDLNIEEVRSLLNTEENKQEGKVIEIDINVIEPNVKLADITYTLYKDKLAGYTTYFDPAQWARANNLAIALKYLNGKVIMPGETFSYNAAIGDTTVAKGYMAAATFKGGRVVQELGGGICQTTSTLYNVALMANLEIVERHQHGLPVGYVPPSRDATVYSPNLDFKFKNTRNYPVKIVTSYSSSGSLNISLFGTKEETEYEVLLSHRYISTIPFTTKYEYDNTMPEGSQVIISYGVNGYTSESYITKKLNGVVTYSAILSQDKYNAQQQIVKIGTKKQE